MEQATFLQVDLESLFGAAVYNQKIDFEKIWNHFNGRESEFLTGAVIYNLKSAELDSSRFETKLKALGYELKTKSLAKSFRRSRENQAFNAVPLTIDCITRLHRYDKLILMTNNGIFTDLCKYLKSLGKTVELWSFANNYDPALEAYADKMHFIDDDFCLQKPNINVFGINFGLDRILDSTSLRGVI